MVSERNQTERDGCCMLLVHGSRWQGREEHGYKNTAFRVKDKEMGEGQERATEASGSRARYEHA